MHRCTTLQSVTVRMLACTKGCALAKSDNANCDMNTVTLTD